MQKNAGGLIFRGKWARASYTFKSVLLAVAAVLCCVSQAKASLITFSYEGIVTDQFVDTNNVLDGSIFIGQTFSGSYTFESTTLDRAPNDSAEGRYEWRNDFVDGFTAEFSIGNYTFGISPIDPSGSITILDDLVRFTIPQGVQLGPEDSYNAAGQLIQTSGPLFPLPVTQAAWGISLDSLINLSVITSDALPTIPPDIALFEEANQFRFGNGTGDLQFRGTITSLTVALPPGVISDPTGDTDNPEIDIELVDVFDDGTTFFCILNVATTAGLLNKSTFRCHIDFDDEENSDFAGKGCDLPASTPYRLGTNSLCTTSDIALIYRVSKRGFSCTGLPSIMCSELETDAEGDTDAFCDGTVGSDAAVSCTISLRGSLDDIADVRDAECSVGECLTDKDGATGEYDVYGFFESKYSKGDRDHVLNTDDNEKPNVEGEVTTITLIDPTLP